MATITDNEWTNRLADIMPANFLTNRSDTFAIEYNKIVTTLFNRIGRTYIAGQPNAYNPFDSWNSAVMDYGDTVEKITLPFIKGLTPDFDPAEPNPFKTVKPTAKTQYWKQNDALQYKQTLWQNQIQKAFESEQSYGSFTGEIMNMMYKSVGWDNYIKWKKYLSNADFVADGAKDTLTYTDDEQYGIDMWLKIKDWVTNKLRYISADYNKMGVETSSPSVDVVITTATKNLMDAALKGVYNVDKIEMPGLNFIEIDSFATAEGAGSDTTQEVLILTKGMCEYIPRTPVASALYNPENLYTNYWYTQEGLYLIDTAQNAVTISRAS